MGNEPRTDGDAVAAASTAFRTAVDRFRTERRLSDAEMRLLVSQWLAESIQKMVALEWKPMLPPEMVCCGSAETHRIE